LHLAAGFAATLFAGGLNGPTALAFGPAPDPLNGGSRRLYVAQLNGGENDGAGQIIAIDAEHKTQDVVLDKLAKPTGLAWFNDALYVVSYRDVLKFTAKDGKLSGPQTLVSGVRFNGRSLGHIKAGPSSDPFTGESEPRLYFHSSGGDPAVSGHIFSMRMDGSDQRTLARGLKNGYAFTWSLRTDAMYATEIGDNIADAPLEEINQITLDGNYGWPNCPAEQTCAGVQSPIATFAAHTTPTGIAWWNDSLIVALWGPADPHVTRIALDAQGQAGAPSDFARGLQNPMDVIVTKQGTLLLLDFAGEIWEVVKT
jgi:glucose/arabinose dehydrogenase